MPLIGLNQGITNSPTVSTPSSSSGLIRGRPFVQNGNLRTDVGSTFRGVTFGLDGPGSQADAYSLDRSKWQLMWDKKFNLVRQTFSLAYDGNTLSTMLPYMDTVVSHASATGMYVMFMYDGAYGNADWTEINAVWPTIAARYANNTNVIFEQGNEWHWDAAEYDSAQLDLIANLYNVMHAAAPNTYIGMFTPAFLGNGNSIIAAADAVKARVGAANFDKAFLTYHAYSDGTYSPNDIANVKARYPSIMTETTVTGNPQDDPVNKIPGIDALGVGWCILVPRFGDLTYDGDHFGEDEAYLINTIIPGWTSNGFTWTQDALNTTGGDVIRRALPSGFLFNNRVTFGNGVPSVRAAGAIPGRVFAVSSSIARGTLVGTTGTVTLPHTITLTPANPGSIQQTSAGATVGWTTTITTQNITNGVAWATFTSAGVQRGTTNNLPGNNSNYTITPQFTATGDFVRVWEIGNLAVNKDSGPVTIILVNTGTTPWPNVAPSFPTTPYLFAVSKDGSCTIQYQNGRQVWLRVTRPAYGGVNLCDFQVRNTSVQPVNFFFGGGVTHPFAGQDYMLAIAKQRLTSEDDGTYTIDVYRAMADNSFTQIQAIISVADNTTNYYPQPKPAPQYPIYFEDFRIGYKPSLVQTYQSQRFVYTGTTVILDGSEPNPTDPDGPVAGCSMMTTPAPDLTRRADYGFGNGLFEFRAKYTGMGPGQGQGPAIILWPADNIWPGPEIDLGEIGYGPGGDKYNGGTFYHAFHWKRADNGNNDQDIFVPNSSNGFPNFDHQIWHTHACLCENGRVTHYIDGKVLGVATHDVVPDFANGGVNHTVGLQNQATTTKLECDWIRHIPLPLLAGKMTGGQNYGINAQGRLAGFEPDSANDPVVVTPTKSLVINPMSPGTVTAGTVINTSITTTGLTNITYALVDADYVWRNGNTSVSMAATGQTRVVPITYTANGQFLKVFDTSDPTYQLDAGPVTISSVVVDPGGGGGGGTAGGWYEGFDNNTGGQLTHLWGNASRFSASGGIVRLSIPAGQNDATGLMEFPGGANQGHGYGLYEIRYRMSDIIGGAALTWPADNAWPGAEEDMGEISFDGRFYMAHHWSDNGNDAAEYFIKDNFDPTQWFTAGMLLKRDYLEYFVNGVSIGSTTNNVTRAYGDGPNGMNRVFGIMVRGDGPIWIECDWMRFTPGNP